MKHIRYCLAALTILYIVYCTVGFFRFVFFQKEVKRCGEITFKGNRDQVNKHSTDVEFILVVRYDDTGRKEDEHVSASTWSSFNVGDHICFTENERVKDGFFGFISFAIGLVGAFCCAVVIIILLVFFFRWVFIGKTFAESWDDMQKD